MAKKPRMPKHVQRNLAALERMKAESKELARAKPPGRGSPQFVLRYSAEMRDQVARLAKARGLSINSLLIDLLARALNSRDDVEQLQSSMGEVFDRLERLELRVRSHDEDLDYLSRRDPNEEIKAARDFEGAQRGRK